jgi:hypothetical protein
LKENIMKMRTALAFAALSLLVPGVGFTQAAFAQQGGHKYLYRAVLTAEGVKDLKTRTAVALRGNIVKLFESVGCKYEFWYFDFLNTTAYGGVDCPNEAAVAAIMLTVNAAPYARLTYWSVLSAEELDKAATTAANTRPPQQQ